MVRVQTLGGTTLPEDVHFAVAKCIYIERRSMNIPLMAHPQSVFIGVDLVKIPASAFFFSQSASAVSGFARDALPSAGFP